MRNAERRSVLFLRSLLFNLAFYAWTILAVLAFTPALLLPRGVLVYGQRLWANGVIWLMARLAGIHVAVRGREHMPGGAAIIASKHQSAWDTLIWHREFDTPAIVLKRELLAIPIYGWMCRKSGMIPIDRVGSAAALRRMLAAARAAAAEARPIVIFPQGTRTAPGEPPHAKPYQPGVAALYRGADLPVVPVALNSGLFWPRRRFLRFPGTLTLEYLEPIPPGLDRRRFLQELERRIETATARLEREALDGVADPATDGAFRGTCG